MTNQFLRHVVIGIAFLISSCAAFNTGAAVPISINAYGIHSAGKIVYRYQVINDSSSIIHAVTLGAQGMPLGQVERGLPGTFWSLNPVYDDDNGMLMPMPLPLSECKPFVGMDCQVVLIPEYLPISTMVRMHSVENNLIPLPTVFSGANHIRPGMLSSVAELTVPLAYQSAGFLTASGTVFLLDRNTKNPNGTIMTSAVVPFTKVDGIAPTLSVTLTPTTLWPPNDKLVPVTATITVTDDYDPEPEIKLESITATETLDAGDIQDAQLGTDDRDFSLAAKRAGNNLAGRIYTVTYSATDASGNKANATATVTVPHDQRR